MMSITEAWLAIRESAPGERGWHVRRLDPHGSIRLLAAISMPNGKPALLLDVGAGTIPAGTNYPKCVGFSIRPEMLSTGLVRLYLERGDERFDDLFAILCQDVADHAASATNETAAFRQVLGRLNTWQRFVDDHGLNRLSEEKQIGLFAELIFLSQHLLGRMTAADAFGCWRGPLGEPHDFELHEASVEIKATSAASPSVVRISNLDQLEPTGSKPLYLTMMQILEDNSAGQSLPELASSVRRMIADVDTATAIAFDAVLMQVGYLHSHADSYGTRRKCFRRRDFEVSGAFPRLTRDTVPVGVSDASYQIRIDSCIPFEQPLEAAYTGANAGVPK